MLKKILLLPRARHWAALLGAALLLTGGVAHAQTPLAGAYTINNALPTGGTNFTSFSDAATRLNTDGMSAPVTISVSGGPYTEQFLLNQITGSSATNTLTVNGNGNTLQFASSNTSQRAVVQLNGTDYTTINNLVINSQGGTYGYGILLTNVADNNRLTNNTINGDLTSTSTNFAGIVTSGSTSSATTAGISANNLLVEGNTIIGGYYGIDLYGNTTATPNTGNILRNNQVRDFYINGIYLGYQEGTQIIGNDISRPTRTVVSSFNGVYAFGTSRGLNIEKNRLHDSFTGSPASTTNSQPIFLATSTGPSATQPNDVVNNVVYNINGNGVSYGIYNSASPYIRMYNNSISLDDQASTATTATYGIYTNAANNDVRNNVISLTRTGTGAKYALYYTIAGTISNYNDLYAPTGNVGYFATAFATLAAWQAANGGAFDQNSLSVNPQYTAPATGNLLPLNLALSNAGLALARVIDDITGAARSATPTPGAYELNGAAITVDLSAAALLAPAAGATCYGATETVTVQVRNSGTAPLNFATNPATVTVVVTPLSGGTQTLTTTLSTGTLAAGATQSITLPGTANLAAAGTYSFGVTATVTGDQNPSNNLLTPSPTRTVLAPVGGTLAPGSFTYCGSGSATLQVSGTANGSLQYQSSPDGTTFTDVPGATAASYTTPALTSTTYYRVRVSCNTTVVAYSNVATITVRNPQIASTNGPLTICPGTTATLTATAAGSGQVRFFAAATGGPALASPTAGSYTTPALTASTTYYAEATESSPETVGKPSTTGLDGTDTATGGLYFTATAATTINSVTVYRAANAPAGTATVYLLVNSSTSLGNALTSAVVPVPANTSASVSPAVLTLNFAVPSAGNFTLFLSAATPALVRDNTTATPATAFPYTAPSGIVSITGTTLAPYYYYFYNWQIAGQCLSASRTAIQVNVTTPPTATLTASTQPSGAVQLTATPLSGATYQFFKNGVAVGPASTASTLTLLSGAQNGSYTVTITPATGCAPLPPAAVNVTVLGTHAASLAGVSLTLYPNPTPDGTLTLELTGPRATAAQLTVLSALGQQVQRSTLAVGTTTLRLPGLAPGVYTLRLQTAEGVLTQRFVRE